MTRATRALLVLAVLAPPSAGCATAEREPAAADPLPVAAPAPPAPPAARAPGWISDLLDRVVGREGAVAARARLFQSGEDAEVFAGLVAFSSARDPELRRIAAWHLSGAGAFAASFGVDGEAALEALREDEDAEARRLARLRDDHDAETATDTPLGIVSGEATVGSECRAGYPGLPGVSVHILVKGVAWGSDPWSPSLHYWAEGRTECGGVLGGTGSHSVPDMTTSHFMGFATENVRYGFDLRFRVLDGGTVRWWLRALKRPTT